MSGENIGMFIALLEVPLCSEVCFIISFVPLPSWFMRVELQLYYSFVTTEVRTVIGIICVKN